MPITFTRKTWVDYQEGPYLEAGEMNRLEAAIDALINGTSRAVRLDGDTMTGGLTLSAGDLNVGAGVVKTGGVTRISNAGAGTFTNLTDTGLTATRALFAGVGGNITDSENFTFDSVSNALTIGSSALAGNPRLSLDSAAGQTRYVRVRTGTVARWAFGGGLQAESGANAGTAFELLAFADDGALIDTPLSIARAAGGAVTAGGSTSRPWNFTGAIQTGGTQRISSTGAATVTSISSTDQAGTGERLVSASAAGAQSATIAISAFAKTILDDADAAATRATLGIIGAERININQRSTTASTGYVKLATHTITAQAQSSFSHIEISSRGYQSASGDNGIFHVYLRIKQTSSMSSPLDIVQCLVERSGSSSMQFGYTIDEDSASAKTVTFWTYGPVAFQRASYTVLASSLTTATYYTDDTLVASTPAGWVDAVYAPKTVASLTATNLTSGRIVRVTTGGQMVDDAGLTTTQITGVTDGLIVGEGTLGASIRVVINTSSGQDGSFTHRWAGITRWAMTNMATTANWRLRAFNASASEIDAPIDIVNASAGLMTLGGSTARPLKLTGVLQDSGGNTRMSAVGAMTPSTLSVTDQAGTGERLVSANAAGAQSATTAISTFAKTILDDADAAAVRATIGAASTGDIAYESAQIGFNANALLRLGSAYMGSVGSNNPWAGGYSFVQNFGDKASPTGYGFQIAANVGAHPDLQLRGRAIAQQNFGTWVDIHTASTLPVSTMGKALVNRSTATGWSVATGTPTRSTFATGSVTLPQLAERVKALIDDLISHGLIGA